MKNIIVSIFKVFFILVFVTGCEVAITPLDEGPVNPVVNISTPEGTNEIDDENGVTIIEIGNTPGQISLDDIRTELKGEGSENFKTSVELVGDLFIINAVPKEGFGVTVTTTFTLFATVYINESPSCEKEIVIILHGTNTAPLISATVQTSVNEDTLYTLVPVATDVDVNDTLLFSILNQPTWATFDTATGTLTGTPANGDVGISTGIEISVTDGVATSTLPAFDITVLNTNDAPLISATVQTSVNEDTLYTLVPVATDVDVNDTLLFSILNQPTWATFDTATGTLTGTPANGDVGISTGIEISVTDGVATSTLPAFDITVLNTNDAPLISATVQTSVNEDTLYTLVPVATDVDVNDTLLFSILNQPTWATFDTATGTLTGTPANGDVGISTGIEISVTDGVATSTLPAFDITVLNTNDAPLISATVQTSVNEDTLYTLVPVATDVDVNDTLLFSILNQPTWATFDTATGTLTGTPANGDVGISTGIEISVTDGVATSTLPAFDITVLNTNDAPLISATVQTSVNEDTLYTLVPVATDVDVNDTLLFSILNQPTWATFDTATGTLTGTPANGDVGISTGIEISVTDGVATSTLPAFDITVLNTNDAPLISATVQTSVNEDTLYTLVPVATDVDVNDTLLFSILNQPTWATFDTATGTLTGTPANGDVGISTGIEISVTDGVATSTLPAFDITVLNTNDAPLISATVQTSVNEDTLYTLVPVATDVDVNDTLLFSILNQPTWATFDTATGTLTGTPANGDVGISTGIEISVTDGVATSTLPAFDITVLNTNDAPLISATVQTSVNEDTLYTLVPVATDVDVNDTLLFSILNQPTWATFDTATGTLTGTPANGDVGISTGIEISVTDGVATSTLPAFDITVLNTNDAPLISATVQTSVNEDTLYTLVPVATDVDVNDTLLFSILNQPTWATFDTATGTLTGTPANGDVGISTGIEISVTDGVATSTLPAFDITVLNTNDAPLISATVQTSVNEDTLYTLVPVATDVDVNDTLLFSILNQPTWATFDTATGTLTGTPANGDVGISTGIEISVTDGVATSTLPAFDITVLNTNDAPLISATVQTSVNEDTLYTLVPVATDVDVNDTLLFSILNQPTWATFDTATGTLTGTPANGDVGISTGIEISVTDGVATSTLPAFDITVLNTNDAPIATGDNLTMNEDENLTYTLLGSDIDANATLTYSISLAPLNGDINLTNDTIVYTPNADYYGTDGFTFIVTDENNVSSSEARVDISISDIPEANIPPIAEDMNVSMDVNTSTITIDLNASDVDLDTLTYIIVDTPAYGTLTAMGGNQFLYDRGAYTGNTSFTYKANDGTDDSNIATVYINSNIPNVPPIAYDQSVLLDASGAPDIILDANDTDFDTLTYRIDVNASYGTLTLVGDTVTYTPDINFTGTDSFTFVANDGVDDSNKALVSVTVGSTLSSSYLFGWCDDSNGVELWSTDGTAGNTALLKGISAAGGSSNPTLFNKINNISFFTADDGVNGMELWKSEGTTGSTVLVKDIYEGSQSASPSEFVDINGTLFFTADDGVNGRELWKSDGTTIGTTMVRNINELGNSSPYDLINVNGTLFFIADNGVDGVELWKSDGTQDGTVLLEDITVGGSTYFAGIGAVNGLLVFSADIGFFDYQLFSSDGNTVQQVGNFDLSLGQAYFTTVNDLVFFSAFDTLNRTELWTSDGLDTQIVKDINTDYDPDDIVVGHSFPEDFTEVNGTLYFTAIEQDGWDRELWRSDGTEAGTTWVTPATKDVSQLTSANGKLYLIATTNTSKKFYHVDESGALALFQFTFSGGTTDIIDLIADKEMVYFRVLKDAAPDEFWSYDTVAGIGSQQQIATGCTP